MANGEKVQVSHLPMPEMLECMQMRGLHGKESCERYSGFRQLSIFDTHQEPQYHSVPGAHGSITESQKSGTGS